MTMRIALVYDYLIQYGGGERLLETISEMFPESPIYTVLYDKEKTFRRFEHKNIIPSFLQNFYRPGINHYYYFPLMPFAIRRWDFSNYHLVISLSASFAKGIRTPPHVFHLSYLFTPTRFLLTDPAGHLAESKLPSPLRAPARILQNILSRWDMRAGAKPDKIITFSRHIRDLIQKHYGRQSEILPPPVDVSGYSISRQKGNYYAMVGRLLPYKRFDLAIRAFNDLGLPLKIVGIGRDTDRLKNVAGPNIEFLGWQSDVSLRNIYADAKALIFPQTEDFGLVAVESLASGTPVIAHRSGGALDIVEGGKTGIFFDEQTPESLKNAITKFEEMQFDPEFLHAFARRFDVEIFKKKFKNIISECIKT